jgi:hypothetical protein
MINAKEFFLGFQADYYAYRALRLKSELESLKEKPTSFPLEIYDYSFEDHLRSIKIDIRQTYFQSVETLFELIFSMKPVDGTVNDSRILKNLIKRKDHYNDIQCFAEEKGGMDFLYEEVMQGSVKIGFIQYLFYGLLDLRKNDNLQESLDAIIKILKIVAKDISDRREYNCYKHGLRIFPHANMFQVHNSETDSEILKWDLKDSMTFVHEDNYKKEINVVTKMFDPETDLNMTFVCNNLISNLIMIRRRQLNNNKPVGIVFFNSENIEKCSKHHSICTYLTFSLEQTI